jgi:hypothetical protein
LSRADCVVAVDTIETFMYSAHDRGYYEGGDKPTVSLSRSSIFIFAAEVPVAALSPADTILVM